MRCNMTKVVIVVKDGLVTRVFSNDPENTDVEVIDLDVTDEDAENAAAEQLEKAEKELHTIF